MTLLPELSEREVNAFHKVIQDSLSVSRHQELFQWLNGDIQSFIPHDILITAWGDFTLGLIHLNIVSSLPGLRTTEVDKQQFLPFLMELFVRWADAKRMPFELRFADETFHICYCSEEYEFDSALSRMRSAIVHGIKDERGRHDCLYIALSDKPSFEAHHIRAMKLLLPYIDTALRQVAHLPVQYPDLPEANPDAEPPADNGVVTDANPWGLSDRELQIMKWICLGKTNSEIGQILDISFFTVKNHLQRIFRKLDVLNRAQAVAKFDHPQPKAAVK